MDGSSINTSRIWEFCRPFQKGLVPKHDMPKPAIIRLCPERVARCLLSEGEKFSRDRIDKPGTHNFPESLRVSSDERLRRLHGFWKISHSAWNASVNNKHAISRATEKGHGPVQKRGFFKIQLFL